MTLHGDKSQYERTLIMNSFKTTSQILIATDIASRGIDVKNIKNVINFECPKTIEAYIHRIGRTGRAGETGRAVSLLEKCQSNVKFAIELIKVFESSGYPVSKEL
jgi:superfamily II DNA/RNA helicase